MASESITTQWSGRHEGKDALRAEIWTALIENGVNVGEPIGRIPGFAGCEQAAALMAAQSFWVDATTIKSNPDTAHVPVRLRALQDGKLVYMAVPQLKTEKPFVELNPDDLRARGVRLEDVATHQGAMEHGRYIAFEEMLPVDLVLAGCVAVTREGGRTGKGAGFADLELGIMSLLGLLKPGVQLAAAVHPIQIVDPERVPMLPHDWALDWIVTPNEVIRTAKRFPRPYGIDWEQVRPEQLETIPVLRRLKEQHSA